MPGQEVRVLQNTESAKNVPAEVRRDFVVKVYGLVITMLLISFGLASPFVFKQAVMDKWIFEHAWVLWTCAGFLLLQHVFHMALMMEMVCGGGACMKAYLRMFMTVPINLAYLFTYATFMGVVLGMICLEYQAPSVCLVFGLCAVIITALTIYAVTTKADFTGMGAYILVAVMGLLLTGFICAFLPLGPVKHRIIGGLGSIIFGWIIVYDTQLIFGSASGTDTIRKYEYTIDMYAFAAFELYLDFVNFFIYMLRLLGDRR